MTEDFEDIYKEKETIPEDVVKWNDGSLFSFINTSEFKGNPLKQKVTSGKEFKELVNSLFALGINMKTFLVRKNTSGYFYPFFSLVKKDSNVLHGTMLPAQNVYSLDSLKSLLQNDNEKNLKEEDLTHILHMIEIKSHSCSKKDCTCPISVYENKLLIQSFNLEKPEKSLTFSMGYKYTEDGVVFDEDNIDVVPIEKFIHTGKYSNVNLDQSKDLPYN